MLTYKPQQEEEVLSFEPSVDQPELLKAWETFTETGRIRTGVVPPHIAESWLRSRDYNVDPFMHSEKFRLPDDKYKERISANQELLNIAMPILESIYSSLEQTRYLVVLYDSDGYHLTRIGSRADLDRSMKLRIMEGLCFDEYAAGTCGFSLVKRLGHPIQIVGCEHYSTWLHYVTGAYAPILSHKERQMIGVVGITGAKTLPNSHTLAIAIAASTALENLLAVHRTKDELSIFTKAMQLSMDSIDDGIVLVDSDGRILHSNATAKRVLQLYGLDTTDIHISKVKGFSAIEKQIMRAYRLDRVDPTEQECEINGQRFLATINSVRKDKASFSGTIIQLRSIRKLSRLFHDLTGQSRSYTLDSMVGSSNRIKEIKNIAKTAAQTNIAVLIEGGSGTGKEVLAQAIHNASSRRRRPFVAVNCAAIPTELFETTLFGHERGAFTGAVRTHIGKFELADGGTLFLDEIGEMPLIMQTKMLRVLEDQMIERIGAKRPSQVDVRIVAATNRNLHSLVLENKFRADLFYRLHVFRIELPPLRERKTDIPDLLRYFAAELAPLLNKNGVKLSDSCLDMLMGYDWPGNIRELKNAVQYALVRLDSETLQARHFEGYFGNFNTTPAQEREEGKEENLSQMESQAILAALTKYNGNKSKAAESLGIGRATLYRKLRSIS
jgi:transcriptional regulator with PAS, ATPase and Fis domain